MCEIEEKKYFGLNPSLDGLVGGVGEAQHAQVQEDAPKTDAPAVQFGKGVLLPLQQVVERARTAGGEERSAQEMKGTYKGRRTGSGQGGRKEGGLVRELY